MEALPEPGMRLCVGVTGHRDLIASDTEAIEAGVEALFRKLAGEFPDLPLELLTPLAAGGDQLAARVAVRMGVPLVVVLPMERSEYEKDFRDPEVLAEFCELLGQAERVISLPPAPGNGEPPFTGEARNVQYAQLGVFISNHCQILLAL